MSAEFDVDAGALLDNDLVAGPGGTNEPQEADPPTQWMLVSLQVPVPLSVLTVTPSSRTSDIDPE